MRVLPMSAGDLAPVLQIERRASTSPWSRALFLDELRIPFSRIDLACDVSGPPLGFICWWNVAGEAQVLNLAVDPAQQRRGYGRALLEHAMWHAADGGAQSMSLEVRSHNQPAISLYRAARFRTVGRRPAYYRDGGDAIVMRREIEV